MIKDIKIAGKLSRINDFPEQLASKVCELVIVCREIVILIAIRIRMKKGEGTWKLRLREFRKGTREERDSNLAKRGGIKEKTVY